jgi:hypothetical protein
MAVIVVGEAKLDSNKILRLVKGDITERDVDVIEKKRWSNHQDSSRRLCSGWFCSDYYSWKITM